jgi:NADH-quinone oxidoreductase subunit M
MAQKDWKKLIAYSSVSHLGFVMLGIFAFNQVGINGGLLQMVNHGLSTVALFLIVGIIYERRHTRLLADYGGLSKVMPVFAVMFMIFTLSSIGMPALNGFIGEFTILAGAFQIAPALGGKIFAILGATGIVLGAAYMLWLYQRTMFGKLDNPDNENLKDLNLREWVYLTPLVILCFWIGLYPKPFFAILEPATERLTIVLEQHRPAEFAWDGEAAPLEAMKVDDAGLAVDTSEAENGTGGAGQPEKLTAGGRP